MHDVTR